MPDAPHLLTERDGAVHLITLNRPERRNALNGELDRDLLGALEDVAEDDAVRAIVITGAGPSFCAGVNVHMLPPEPSASVVHDHILSHYLPLIERLTQIRKPILAAINGVAAGAGCSLALACDLRIMADDATLLQAFSTLGLIPDAGSTWLLARQIGFSRAYQMAIEGQPVSAEQCLAWGLTNKVVPAADLLTEARAWAHRLAERPTVALGLTKLALHRALTTSLRDAVLYEAELQGRCARTDDFREGIAAFIEKRRPSFSGR